MTTASQYVAVVVGLGVLLSIAGHAATIANALTELARIAGREHGIREQQRAAQDLANVETLEGRRR